MSHQLYCQRLGEEREGTLAILDRLLQLPNLDESRRYTRVQIKLQRIDDAIQRLAQGQYGRCQVCYQAIPPERLQALPYAERCFNCQRQLEQLTLSDNG